MAKNGWIVAFDNLSEIPRAFSDALCCLSTGGGFSTRELYSNDEEKLFDAMRPLLLNGIGVDLLTRPDLADRIITLSLPVIFDKRRLTEGELLPLFDKIRPRVLGAILDAVSVGLRNVASTRLESAPRMADFARWIVACEPALPWKQGRFLQAYRGNRATSSETVLDGSLVGGEILKFIDYEKTWRGSAAELLVKLESSLGERTAKNREWPSTPRKFSGDLRRIFPLQQKTMMRVTLRNH
jgi:hypothetical protein